jgi:phosphoserine phosphatase
MTKIILTRHGHVEGINPERFRGREPLQLTQRGTAEATALAQRIADYGSWQFKTLADAKAQDPMLFGAWFASPHLVRFPNGESLQDLVARTANALRTVLARHPDETIVLVGHDSVNRALLLELLDQPLSAYWRVAQDPCCINEIDVTGGSVGVRRINETQHLEAITEHGRQ